MNYCCNDRKFRCVYIIGACLFFLMFAGLLIYLCFVFDQLVSEDVSGFIALIMYITSTIPFIMFAVLYCAMALKEYQISPEGIVVRNFKTFTTTIPWKDIKEIAICNVHYNTRGPQCYETVIRCSLADEKYGPASGSRKWQSFEYSLSHFRTVILFTYSEERLKEVVQNSALEVSDYRYDKRYIRR